MAEVKISALPVGSTLLTTEDVIVLVQGGGTRKLPLRIFTNPYDARAYGLPLGDAASRPLSSLTTDYTGATFAAGSRTLAQWQAVYPHADALTNQVAWCAFQGSVNAADAAGGGVSTFPAGRFNTTGKTVLLPESAHNYIAGAEGVSMRGAGQSASYLVWTTDAVSTAPGSAGTFIVACANRDATNYGSSGFFEDFSVMGPATQRAAWGVKPCEVSGFALSGRRNGNRIGALFCHRGFDIKGDHARLTSFYTFGCGYGIYWPKSHPALFGDWEFSDGVLDQSSMAGVGCSPDGFIPKSIWTKVIFAVAPVGIYKEMGGSENWIARSVSFVQCQFENLGIAVMTGGAALGVAGVQQGTARPNSQNIRFERPQFGNWMPDFVSADLGKPSGWTRAAQIDINQTLQGFEIDGILEPNLCTPGDVATFKISVPDQVLIKGSIGQLLDGAAAAGKPLFADSTRTNSIRLVNTADSWEGCMRQVNAGEQAAEVGDVMCQWGGNTRRSTGTDADQFAGILMGKAYSDFGWAPIATRGQVTVNSNTAGQDNVKFRPGANGKGVSTGTNAPFGWAYPGAGGTLNKHDVWVGA